MMAARKILVVDGHPDPDPARFVHALAAAYMKGAAGHETRMLRLADLDFPLLRRASDWTEGAPPAAIAAAQMDVLWADHLVILYPLWLGDVPALLKGFLEQTLRPGFALQYREKGLPRKLLAGRTARTVVTMGMPAIVYRLFYGAHSVKSLERNVLKFVGIRPVARTFVGAVESSVEHRQARLEELERLGAAGA